MTKLGTILSSFTDMKVKQEIDLNLKFFNFPKDVESELKRCVSKNIYPEDFCKKLRDLMVNKLNPLSKIQGNTALTDPNSYYIEKLKRINGSVKTNKLEVGQYGSIIILENNNVVKALLDLLNKDEKEALIYFSDDFTGLKFLELK